MSTTFPCTAKRNQRKRIQADVILAYFWNTDIVNETNGTSIKSEWALPTGLSKR